MGKLNISADDYIPKKKTEDKKEEVKEAFPTIKSKEKYKVLVRFEKEDEEEVKAAAKELGLSVGKFIIMATKKGIKNGK